MLMGRRHLPLYLLLLLVVACDSEYQRNQQQIELFTRSLDLVETAGSLLQRPDADQQTLELAINKLDQALMLAFQVESGFLQRLQPLLAKQYQDHFIAGIEAYRLGMESGNIQHQQEGLQRISKWGQYWLKVREPVIQALGQ